MCATRGANISPALSTLRVLPVATGGVLPSGASVLRSRQLLCSPCLYAQILCSQQLAASCTLLALFFALRSFVFSGLQPLFPKQGGYGGNPICCLSGLQYTLRPGSSQLPGFTQPSWTNA